MALATLALAAPASSAVDCQAQYQLCLSGCQNPSVGSPCWQSCSRQYLLCTQGQP